MDDWDTLTPAFVPLWPSSDQKRPFEDCGLDAQQSSKRLCTEPLGELLEYNTYYSSSFNPPAFNQQVGTAESFAQSTNCSTLLPSIHIDVPNDSPASSYLQTTSSFAQSSLNEALSDRVPGYWSETGAHDTHLKAETWADLYGHQGRNLQSGFIAVHDTDDNIYCRQASLTNYDEDNVIPDFGYPHHETYGMAMKPGLDGADVHDLRFADDMATQVLENVCTEPRMNAQGFEFPVSAGNRFQCTLPGIAELEPLTEASNTPSTMECETPAKQEPESSLGKSAEWR